MSKIFVLRRTTGLLIILFPLFSWGQEWRGQVTDLGGQPLVGVNIQLEPSQTGTVSDQEGKFYLQYSGSEPQVRIEFSYVGYRTKHQLLEGKADLGQVILQEDRLGLEEVVVSGDRKGLSRYNSPVIVETLKPELFEQVAALSLAEGLSFSPGLRLENNCQNCGFTQLRINGLNGAYSQILLNSRPIFSSLMGVYGLEMFPATMIERVEVVRGGGSALYGGNAIGGTVNIITKEPSENRFFLQQQNQLIGGRTWETSGSFGASLASKNADAGFNLFGFQRDRDWWDANSDGFSEITELRNQTMGLNAYWKPQTRSKLSLDVFAINEYRRGGSDFERLPHQSRVTEQLEHRILGGGLAYEQLSENGTHQFSFYGSGQTTARDSYYGAGGRILSPGDSLTDQDLLALNAYGYAEDYSLVAGAQYHWLPLKGFQLSIGSEYQSNSVYEEMLGYQREIDQALTGWGNYLQVAWSPYAKWRIQLGNRMDYSILEGRYQLGNSTISQNDDFLNFSPRLNLQHKLNEAWQFRASYARGFRIPQAFNEDLHIETVGGAALFIQLDENLKPEISNSFTSSAEYLIYNNLSEHKLLLTGFYTLLSNPFVLINREALANGTAVQLKSNGDGGLVRGLSLEYQAAFRNGLQIQAAFTAQEAFYQEAQILWEAGATDGLNDVSTDQFLRTPNLYGYLNLDYDLSEDWNLSAALSYTGPMTLARLIDPETEALELVRSGDFVDLQLAAEYQLLRKESWTLKLKGGVKNIFDAYQSDLPVGAERDASYIYGPILPRTYFLSIKLDYLP